ncbi:MAG: hypothetical protein ABIP48_29720 [Planctomycetota bacterium]
MALGKGWVGEKYRPGVMMLAFPDGNVLNAEWKVTIPAGKCLRLRYSLTNQAAASSTNGLKFTDNREITLDRPRLQQRKRHRLSCEVLGGA